MALFHVSMMKYTTKNRGRHVRLMLLERILACWRRPVASHEVTDLLHCAMWAVQYRRIAMAIEMASKVGVFLHCRFVDCCPGCHWGDVEWVVTRWQHTEASGVALVMLHHTMHSVLLQCICMTIKMAHSGDTFVCHHCLFRFTNHCQKT